MPASVLIVDDDATLRLVFKAQMELLGLAVDIAVDGAAAVDLVKKRYYELILLDIHMPRMNGYEAARWIRAYEVEKKRQPIPIIAVTSDPNLKMCLDAGITDCVQKPLLLEDLSLLVANWLKLEASQPIS